MLELYHNDMSSCAQKVRSQLAEKGLDWTSHELNLRAGEQHQPEFLRLNPKGVVPVLVHDGAVITESNIILEYVEDAFPDSRALMPSEPVARAAVRSWLQRLDTGLHLHVAVLSIGIAFREQLLAVHNTPEALEAYFAAIPDPALGEIYREVVPMGTQASRFTLSLQAWKATFADMEQSLSRQEYLVGSSLSLADIGLLPYACRLQHLQLEGVWAAMPGVTAWFSRMQNTTAYRVGIEKWLNPKYLELMEANGLKLQAELSELIG